jgi:hypothetical protein
MAYLYVSNVDTLDRFTQFKIRMDDGTSQTIEKGHVYDLTATELARASRYVVLVDSSLVPADPGSGGGGSVPAGGGNARVLLWDTGSSNYIPSAYRTDISMPREFVGPVDPDTIGTITGPVFGDRWTPTQAPS